MNFPVPSSYANTSPKFAIKIPSSKAIAITGTLLAVPMAVKYINQPDPVIAVPGSADMKPPSLLPEIIDECAILGGQLNGPETITDDKTGKRLPYDVYACTPMADGFSRFRKIFLENFGRIPTMILYGFTSHNSGSAPKVINGQVQK